MTLDELHASTASAHEAKERAVAKRREAHDAAREAASTYQKLAAQLAASMAASKAADRDIVVEL